MSTASPRRPVPAPSRPPARPPRGRWAALAAAGLAIAGGLAFALHLTRPTPQALEPPAITDALRQRVLAALPAGLPAAEGVLEGIAAADVDGDGRPEWAIAYAWRGAPGPADGRAVRPGFAILNGQTLERLYDAPPAGGWSGPQEPAFEEVFESASTVETVDLGPDGLGFMYRYQLESRLGGRMAHGRARLLVPTATGWAVAWEGETETAMDSGKTDEEAKTSEVALEDADGDGRLEILVSETRTLRRLDARDRGPHFSAALPGQRVYRRVGDRYELHSLRLPGAAPLRIRPAPVLAAVRTAMPVQVDANFSEWQAQELTAITGLALSDPRLLMFKRRDRRGIEDVSGEAQLMWDADHLYLRATVTDDHVVPGAAGRELYRGDHLAVWLDRDLAGDFGQIARSDDDWQIGFSPGRPARAHAWVPSPGAHGFQVASRPHVDPYSGGVYGYELEAAIPWADLGGPPPGLSPGPDPAPPGPQTGQPRTYALSLAGMVGLGLVLSDSDAQPQELAYVSNPGFRWADPTSFNTLLLVEAR